MPRPSRDPDVIAFLGPSLPGAAPGRRPTGAARALRGVRVLPPARAGDVLAVLPARPLAIALVDGLFDTTPSVWHREILAALQAGVAVFGGASLGALRAAELSRFGVIGVGRVHGWYRDGVIDDDGEVALLHADAEHGFRPLTLPLVQVRAAAEAARAAGRLDARTAAALVRAAAGIHYTERTWAAVLAAAGLPPARRRSLAALLPSLPDVKAADAEACLAAATAFARARRAGSPAVPAPALPPAPSHLRRLRLARAEAILPAGAVTGADVLARLRGRPDAGRLAADGLRRILLARWARSLGIEAGSEDAAAAERAWLAALGVKGAKAGRRAEALAALALDDGAARELAEGLALEAALLSEAARAVADGPSWDEGLALGARLSGAWLEEAAAAATGAAASRRPPRRRR